VGVRVGQAAALLEAGDPTRADDVLKHLDPKDVAAYQPFWVTLSRVREALGDAAGGAAALDTAVGLTRDPAVRAHLRAGPPRADATPEPIGSQPPSPTAR
jgi:RNA polymerase sigma-70 factor, ECF subfamily